MMRILREFGEVILRDPDIAGFGSFTGSTGGAQTANTGRFFIVLKPRDERESTPRRSSIGCAAARQGQGRHLFLQPTQDITVGRYLARASFQHAAGFQRRRAQRVVDKLLEKMRTPPQITDVRAISWPMRRSSRSRSTATRPRASASRRR